MLSVDFRHEHVTKSTSKTSTVQISKRGKQMDGNVMYHYDCVESSDVKATSTYTCMYILIYIYIYIDPKDTDIYLYGYLSYTHHISYIYIYIYVNIYIYMC